MAFTSHNIQLGDGLYTIPEMDRVLEDEPWLRSAKRYVQMVFGDDLAGKSVIDLGCLEGGYTVAFARMGMRALGLEVRQSNFDNCEYVRERVGDMPLSFVKDDAWNAPAHGRFDVTFCSGLLYHLDKPKAFIDLMSAMTTKMIIINTHFAPEGESEAFNLSPFEQNEGVRGRWYAEHDSDKVEEIENYSWSSWTNKRSFWMARPEILKAMHDNNFDMVFEAFDFLGEDIATSLSCGYYARMSRGLFIGVRS